MLSPQAESFKLMSLCSGHTSGSAAPAVATSSSTQPLRLHGAIRKWPARHLIRACIASADDKQLANLNQSLKRKLDFCLADHSETVWASLKEEGFSIPDRWSLARSRIQLDMAATAHTRDVNLERRLTWRQLNYDSSPKSGVELFCVKEYVIENQKVEAATHETWPILSLGFGYASRIDKTAALCHGIWLQSGPSLLQMQHFCASVYVLLSDQGTEESIANSKDCLEAFLGSKPLEQCDTSQWLFPNALPCLDVNHLFDWVLRYTCDSLPFFSEFQDLSKALAKMLTTSSYSEALCSHLQLAAGRAHRAHQADKGFLIKVCQVEIRDLAWSMQ